MTGKVILKKFVQNEGLIRIQDIAPIQDYLKDVCSTLVPTIYQIETCIFLYQFAKTFFEDFLLRSQDNPAANALSEKLHHSVSIFR